MSIPKATGSFERCQYLAAAVFSPYASGKIVVSGEYGPAIFFALWSMLAAIWMWRWFSSAGISLTAKGKRGILRHVTRQ